MLSHKGFTKDFLMVIGAGGEAPKRDTIFDDSISNLGSYAQQSPGIFVDLALNGGHAKTEAIMRDSFPKSTMRSDFQDMDYNRLIQKYKTLLENNVMKKDDQLLIYINSHGAQQTADVKTHHIATGEGNVKNLITLEGAKLVDLDQLEVIKNLAKVKGVKLAIVDSSCHSGATQALADDHTCVISSTSKNLYSYFNFSPNFTLGMKKGKNLEDLFLQIRSADDSPAMPMISTPAGVEASTFLEEKITPFLYYFDEDQDKLSPFLRKNSNDYQQCIADENYNSLAQTIDQIEKMNTQASKFLWWTIESKAVDLSTFKTLLLKYKKTLDLLRLKSRELGTERLNREEHFIQRQATYPISSNKKYTWQELITTDFTSLIDKTKKRIALETDRFSLADKQGLLAFYQEVSAKKEDVLKMHPDLIQLQEKEKEMKKLAESNYSISAEIAIEERKIYSSLYKNAQKKQPLKSSNPCKDFIL
jgi:hypothetical protein